jgi:hypothetical protein
LPMTAWSGGGSAESRLRKPGGHRAYADEALKSFVRPHGGMAARARSTLEERKKPWSEEPPERGRAWRLENAETPCSAAPRRRGGVHVKLESVEAARSGGRRRAPLPCESWRRHRRCTFFTKSGGVLRAFEM